MTTTVGTVFYIAPELLESSDQKTDHLNKKTADIAKKVDVYSFSIILWEVFFERIPYVDDIQSSTFKVPYLVIQGLRPLILFKNREEIRMWINTTSSIMSRETISNMDNMVDAIYEYFELMKKCWNKEPQERPSFDEIREVLSSILTKINQDH
ncbi:hypothetical protein C9374_007737 [Naegleria lovaniensis]|uniref:Protein kinase domain-containing protein n=1 Tax=Naegleria lovaniensis TaxID=51637 RepID=A0AA88GKC6_NAELO|nr:uncharacterized protein C9374_007737 [Naegleria lovaniensis]KAG2379099.1 hypothetical protein C9374_007737 [Naegleria lovaniensis]